MRQIAAEGVVSPQRPPKADVQMRANACREADLQLTGRRAVLTGGIPTAL
jgi:hypothetical protein